MAAEICESCGTRTVPGARFCHSCGARLDVPVIDIDLFAPRAVEAETDVTPKAGSSRLGAILALVAVIGIVAFSVLTGNDDPPLGDAAEHPIDDAVPTASTPRGSTDVDTTAPAPELSDALDWTRGPELGSVWSLGFVEHDDSAFLFAAGGISPFGGAGPGMQAWRSGDGATWESLGTVIAAPSRVASVVAAPNELLAAGTDIDANPVIWRSEDGVTWIKEQLPVPDDAIAGIATPLRVAGSEDRVVVSGGNPFDTLQRVVEDAVDDIAGVDLFGYGYTWQTSPLAVSVLGPFGLEMLEIPIDSLGYSEEEVAALEEASVGLASSTTIWSRAGTGEWRTATIGDVTVAELATVPDGAFLITSWTAAGGMVSLSSDDGVTWTDTPGTRADAVTRWGGGLVGRATTDELALRVSPDGDTWETVSLADVIPDGSDRFLHSFAAGDGGIAAQVSYWSSLETPGSTASIIKDGFTLTSQADTGGLVLHDGATERLRVFGHRRGASGYDADLEKGTITLLDPATTEPLVTFTVEELRQLESQAGRFHTPARDLIAVTPDAHSWSITWMSDLTDRTVHAVEVGVAKNHVILAVSTLSSPSNWWTEAPTVQLYTAELPPS